MSSHRLDINPRLWNLLMNMLHDDGILEITVETAAEATSEEGVRDVILRYRVYINTILREFQRDDELSASGVASTSRSHREYIPPARTPEVSLPRSLKKTSLTSDNSKCRCTGVEQEKCNCP